jgi:hypothetical protein
MCGRCPIHPVAAAHIFDASKSGIEGDIEMKITSATVFVLITMVLPTTLLADAQSDYKAKFKAGCLAAKQTWIDNSDGSYQCTTSSGEVNKCYKTTPPTPCTHKK